MAQLSLSTAAAPEAPAQPSATVSVASSPPELRGIWIHTYGPYNWDVVMRQVAAAGFNSVFVRVARGVNAIYPSAYLPRDGWAEEAGGDELRKAIDAAHRNGLRFHAWKVCFNSSAGMRAGAGPSAFYQEMSRQDRLSRDPAGAQAAFLNPGDPRNADLEFNALTELARKYDVDGIHLDYIRYTEVPSYDFDYGPVSRAEFEKHLGRPVPNWPEEVYSGSLKQPYEEWERGNINHLVQRLSVALHRLRPGLKLSAAVWRDHRLVRASIKQDWLLWVRQHWLDFVVPMDYTKDDEDFRHTVRAQVANAVDADMPLATGIGSFFLKDPDAVLRQIAISRAEGANGYVLFDYKPEMQPLLDALATGPQSHPAVPADITPMLAWKLSAGLSRKDDVPVYEVGTVLKVKVPAAIPAGSVRLVGQEDPLLATPPSVIFGNVDCDMRLPATSARWRLWFTPTAPGASFPIAGPIIETMASADVVQLKARDLPAAVATTKLKVAIYADGWAASGLFKTLFHADAVQPYLIYHLRPSFWEKADVLIIPELNDVADLSDATVAELRRWVEQGGRLLLTHDAVGYRWHPRMFPEIARGIAASKARKITVAAAAPGVTASSFEHSYPNHVLLEPAPAAVVIAREATAGAAGRAVIVTGKFGRGRVTMDGALPGYKPDAAPPEQQQLLLQLLELS